MTVRGIVRMSMSVMGIILLFSLIHSGADLYTTSGWYAMGVVMAFGGTFPDELATVAGLAGAAIVLYLLFWKSGSSQLGLTGMHAFLCFGVAGLMHILGQPTEVQLWRCPRCYWHGPSFERHLGRCPYCGCAKLEDEHRSIIAGF